MIIHCANCGNDFEAKRSDATFCSSACRMANSRFKATTWEGIVIRGQHETDMAPTARGIIQAECKCCGKTFSRWMESKLARLSRNEVEGSENWGSRSFDHVKFNELMTIRLLEVQFCSDECQQKGVSIKPLKVRPQEDKPENSDGEVGESGAKALQKQVKMAPKRRGA